MRQDLNPAPGGVRSALHQADQRGLDRQQRRDIRLQRRAATQQRIDPAERGLRRRLPRQHRDLGPELLVHQRSAGARSGRSARRDTDRSARSTPGRARRAGSRLARAFCWSSSSLTQPGPAAGRRPWSRSRTPPEVGALTRVELAGGRSASSSVVSTRFCAPRSCTPRGRSAGAGSAAPRFGGCARPRRGPALGPGRCGPG